MRARPVGIHRAATGQGTLRYEGALPCTPSSCAQHTDGKDDNGLVCDGDVDGGRMKVIFSSTYSFRVSAARVTVPWMGVAVPCYGA